MNFYTDIPSATLFYRRLKFGLPNTTNTKWENVTFEKTSFLNLHIYSKIHIFVSLAGSYKTVSDSHP